MRSVPRVGILILHDVGPGVGNFDNVAILISGESGEVKPNARLIRQLKG